MKPLYENAKADLEDFQRTLETTAEELGFVPEKSQFGAARLVERGKSQLPVLEEELNTLRQQQPISEDELKALIRHIAAEIGKLLILVERRTHRQNLEILEELLALQQSELTGDQLQATLRPHMDFEIDKINHLEANERLNADDQELLALHHNNLRIFQEMLSGQRPYGPLHLVNSVTMEEQAILEIDNRLASL